MSDEVLQPKELVLREVQVGESEVMPPVRVTFKSWAKTASLRGQTYDADWVPDLKHYILPWSRLPAIPIDGEDGYNIHNDTENWTVFHRFTPVGLEILPTNKASGHEWDEKKKQPKHDWADLFAQQESARRSAEANLVGGEQGGVEEDDAEDDEHDFDDDVEEWLSGMLEEIATFEEGDDDDLDEEEDSVIEFVSLWRRRNRRTPDVYLLNDINESAVLDHVLTDCYYAWMEDPSSLTAEAVRQAFEDHKHDV